MLFHRSFYTRLLYCEDDKKNFYQACALTSVYLYPVWVELYMIIWYCDNTCTIRIIYDQEISGIIYFVEFRCVINDSKLYSEFYVQETNLICKNIEIPRYSINL